MSLFSELASSLWKNARRRRVGANPVALLEQRALLSVTAGTPWASFGASSQPSLIVTLGKGGTVTVTNTGVGPYDSIEDAYIGVVNNSGKTVKGMNLSAPIGSEAIFGFDGDGIQTYGSPAPTGLPTGVSLNGYEGPDNYFAGTGSAGGVSFGKVVFIGGLKTGQQTYFSLEGTPSDINLTVGDDLAIRINNNKVTPSIATDLHLLHFWGGETVRINANIDNLSPDPVKGSVKVEVFLSTSNTVAGSVTPKPIRTVSGTVDIPSAGTQAINLDVAISKAVAATLTPGQKYYFVLRLSSPIEAKDDGSVDSNNLAATSDSYEFVGTPSQKSFFTSTGAKSYVKFIRDALAGKNPFTSQGATTPTDGQHFTAAFESSGGYDHPNLGAYLDSKGIPTIGIGINLNAVSGATATAIADAVKTFYATQAANHVAGYSNINSSSTSQVIQMLKTQAAQAGKGHQGQDGMTTHDAQVIFDGVYAVHQTAALNALGGTVVPNSVLWVLTDIDFNVGSVAGFPGLLGALKAAGGPDYVRAGFQLIDSKRTADVQEDRTLAGYEYLLLGHLSQVGSKT